MKWLSALLPLVFAINCGNEARATIVPSNPQFRFQQFMPDNTLDRYDSVQQPNITETEFNDILTDIETIYAPIFKAIGGNLVLERAWDDSTVNAYADQQGVCPGSNCQMIVHMYGGMARRNEMNVLGFGLVACHEIGHHLGGFPLYSDSRWAANEGQSDYFANFACARKVFGRVAIPDLIDTDKARCDAAWGDQVSRDNCYKALDGGLHLGKLLAVLGGQAEPKYATPDPSIVKKTSDAHPRAQCRVDTYLAGSLCSKTWNDSVIPKSDGAVCENRPRCWFAPASTPNPTPTPSPDPNPNPDPEPGEGDLTLMNLFNQYRASVRLATLAIDTRLICAAETLAQDIGPIDRCSHIGSQGDNFRQRLAACGYSAHANEMLACRYSSPEKVMNAWIRDGRNRVVLVQRYWKTLGCASNNGYYVCLPGI
jgi:uncharacterized protein YkwD